MSMIPEAVYRLVERRLRRRWTAKRKAEEALTRAREKASDISAPSGSAAGRKGGKPGSRTERGALAVIRAEKRLETVMKWEDVFRRADDTYPEDSNEGFVIGMIYGNGMSQAELARMSGCSRQTVRIRQDRYIVLAAFLAAQAGLIREEVTDNGNTHQKS